MGTQRETDDDPLLSDRHGHQRSHLARRMAELLPGGLAGQGRDDPGRPPAPHLSPDPERRPVFSFAYRLARAKVIMNGDIGSMFEGPNVGDPAPDFTLEDLHGGQSHSLSDSRGKKPVVLIFGNYTCPPHRSESGVLEQLYKRYGDRATFLRVYIREATPWGDGGTR